MKILTLFLSLFLATSCTTTRDTSNEYFFRSHTYSEAAKSTTCAVQQLEATYKTFVWTGTSLSREAYDRSISECLIDVSSQNSSQSANAADYLFEFCHAIEIDDISELCKLRVDKAITVVADQNPSNGQLQALLGIKLFAQLAQISRQERNILMNDAGNLIAATRYFEKAAQVGYEEAHYYNAVAQLDWGPAAEAACGRLLMLGGKGFKEAANLWLESGYCLESRRENGSQVKRLEKEVDGMTKKTKWGSRLRGRLEKLKK